ncbi:proline racemase family protein [Salipaludibacillus aurantiacus]|uniref:Proline racemase/trans-L-3-hydroxyproline dehydratase n=1 Tax=Salipaludibacillus aurantiacus TaxID=1601833 RepID=A0A1H9W6F8_9BACI|nr:proline racemase family protein [Salipaludibacillus aurantiacus]SES29359.1 proline racemase/trans-L-3-hydroxyproline dehydratase [Salipaludibacillus aurantiacus]
MIFNQMIQTIETHTYGEPTRIINGGLLKLKGETVAEQRDYMAENYDWLRRSLIQEPRGHRDMFGALLLPPTQEGIDFGVIFMDNTNFLNMCGHATIGVATAIVEMGFVEAVEPETKLVLETPAGLVYPVCKIENNRVSSVSFENVPGFLEQRDVKLNVEGIGEITTDISFGGNYFAWVDVEQLDVEIDVANGTKLKKYAALIKEEVNKQLTVQHPTKPYINKVDIVTFFGKPTLPEATYKNVHVFSDRQADRSPGGTGTTAMVSRMVGRGELDIGEEVVCEGFVGGTFTGKALNRVKLGDVDAVATEVTGTAFVTGFQNILIDPNDPFKHGFKVD